MPLWRESLSASFDAGHQAYGAPLLSLFQVAFNARLNVFAQQALFLIFE